MTRDSIATHVGVAEGAAYAVTGDRVIIKLTGEQTGGRLGLAEVTSQPGSGPPPHTHTREDESFHILDGEATFTVGGKAIRASAGSMVLAPRGVEHCFRNTGRVPLRMLVGSHPAGLERFFAEVGVPLAPGAPSPPFTPEAAERTVRVAAKYGIEIPPPR